jgi:Cellulase (glycosyl hydrolase family 5)
MEVAFVRRHILLVLTAALAVLVPAVSASASKSQFTMLEAPDELLSGDPAATLDQVKALGADGIRIQLAWRSVAPSPDAKRAPSFNATDPNAYAAGGWARYDAAIAGARERGLKVQITVTGPAPAWATPSKRDGLTKPDAAAFGKFATAVGRRYGKQVALWSVWNEPNLGKLLKPLYEGSRLTSPMVYRELYLKAYSGLKSAGVRAPILLGELAPQSNPNRSVGTIAPLRFLRAMLCLDGSYKPVKVGGRRCASVPAQGVAMHPYSSQPGPFYRPVVDPDNVTIAVLPRLTGAIDKAAKAGALPRGLPLYLTEFGVQSFPDRFLGVPLDVQSDYRSISERIAYLNPRVKSFSQYLLRDDEPRGDFSAFESGLYLHGSSTPKPAWYGFRLPLVAAPVNGGASRTTLWGLVRPATGAGSVTVEYRDGGGAWKTLGTVRFSAGGYWTKSAATKPGRLWRVSWKAPDGTTWSGSATKVWTKPWTKGSR